MRKFIRANASWGTGKCHMSRNVRLVEDGNGEYASEQWHPRWYTEDEIGEIVDAVLTGKSHPAIARYLNSFSSYGQISVALFPRESGVDRASLDHAYGRECGDVALREYAQRGFITLSPRGDYEKVMDWDIHPRL